jgi:nucleoside-diphosphate-sugar epimerase
VEGLGLTSRGGGARSAFVTGHRGFVGCRLVEVLKEAGYSVTGCDLDLFAGCECEPLTRPDHELMRDVRALTATDLEGHDVVVHLAAISNDPMGELDPTQTLSINRDGAVHVATVAKEAGVERFLLAGSCSVYGKSGHATVAEDDRLDPLTAYARSKIEAESAIALLAGDGFTPVFLRAATAYGHSPMLRVDLVVNNLLACAFATGSIRIMSDGTSWRPLIHCRDFARAFLAFAEAPADAVSGRAVNVGANEENYQVRQIADVVRRMLPKAEIVYTGEAGEDPRSYRVSFDLLTELLPTFRTEYTLAEGMEELLHKLQEHGFSREDWEGARYVRMRTLRERLHLLDAPAMAQRG